ncbi:MAG: citramalate synthase, partial [SAR324 cluster bacterium]|nr:citramalate synthase [SAR324 cluster bacterium]
MNDLQKQKIYLYDTTLRDGSQGKSISFSLADKIKITKLLDAFGMDYIEGGWPGSNPKDSKYFQEIGRARLEHAKVVAFGSTCRVGCKPQDDANIQSMRDANTPTVAIFGKSWLLHVIKILNTSPEENLRLIRESVAYMKDLGREVIYDAEHFFDGFCDDPNYAISTLKAAAHGGADWIVLCDTNGGSLPEWISQVVRTVQAELKLPLGIHAHNDGELAVANSLSAIQAGCRQVQGTMNGYGERCGNANLSSLIPNLELKLGYQCVGLGKLKGLSDLARKVGDIANMTLPHQAPFVGVAAFAHKGGVHVSAIEKVSASYEHVKPELVGNKRDILISELSGRSNIKARSRELGINLNGNERELVSQVKKLEDEG